MALCKPCQSKTTINTPGSCTKCVAPTTHFAYRLCHACSTQLGECEWCQSPLNGGTGTHLQSSKRGVFIVTLRDKDSGKTIKNLQIGEQIHITLDEDQYAWREWDVKTHTWGVFKLLSRGAFVPDQSNPQYGERTFKFEVVGTGTGDIEMHEVRRTWSWWGSSTSITQGTVPGSKSWKVDFVVK